MPLDESVFEVIEEDCSVLLVCAKELLAASELLVPMVRLEALLWFAALSVDEPCET